jgi:leader peptidase (prepilin peptidase)/N-methyltransferase
MPVFAALAGLITGSFLNVVAYRLPRGESLVTPGSHCTKCGAPVRPYDNIPVLGWLLLRGHCRQCHDRISSRYPIVEATTAVLVPVALIDFDHRVIPNKITLPAAILAIVGGLATKPSGVPEQLIAGAAAAGVLLVFVLAYPRGMGMGDVKLAGVLGLFLGRSVAVALLVGVIAATVVGGVIMARVGVKDGRKTAVPFGPFLALGGVVAIFAGPSIVHWYLHTFA